jgi:branched-chain amino acid transport system ATP-binding protein
MSLLAVAHLSKSFGGVRAVHDVSFELEAGEILALIGPNGAGKSTCFNLLCGQLHPDAGSVFFEGRDLVGLDARRIWRCGISRTFQVGAAFGSLTVLENVQLALLSGERKLFHMNRPLAGRQREAALGLLEQVGMAAQASRTCGLLAYGDVKRVELALALAQGPRLLLMDEPTAGMAPGERIALMDLMRSLVGSLGLSVLFTEHNMDAVFAYADRLLVLARGELIAAGDVDSVRRDARVQEVYFGSGRTFAAPAPGASGGGRR